MKRVLIGGIGNVLLGDDGIGPFVAQLLEKQYTFPDYVEVVDLGTPGLELLSHIADADALVVVDSTENGLPAGSITRYTRDDIVRYGAPLRLDPHSPSLAETLLAADLMNVSPKHVALIGVSGAKYEKGVGLSPEAHAAAEKAVQKVLDELTALEVSFVKNEFVSEEVGAVAFQF